MPGDGMHPKQRWFIGRRSRFQQPYRQLLIEWEMMLPRMAANPQVSRGEIAIHNACITELRARLEQT